MDITYAVSSFFVSSCSGPGGFYKVVHLGWVLLSALVWLTAKGLLFIRPLLRTLWRVLRVFFHCQLLGATCCFLRLGGAAAFWLGAHLQESSKRVEVVMSTCWKVWHGGRDPPAEHEKAFKRLREKVRLSG